MPRHPEAGLEWQRAVSGYRDRLAVVASRHDSYTGLEIIHADRMLVVYGVGEPPADIARLMDTAPANVGVRWVKVAHSAAELRRAIRALEEVAPNWRCIEPEGDYSGIRVGLARLPVTDEGMHRLRLRAAQLTDVPVEFFESAAVVPLPASTP